MNFNEILTAAHAAAAAAVAAEVAARPESETDFDCGFAWVTVDGTSPIARHCRQALKDPTTKPPHQIKGDRSRYGDKGYPKGWQWWKPGNFNGQSIRIHRKGSEAFAAELAKYGIRADVGSRLD